MKKQYDKIDGYYTYIVDRILRIAPIVGLSAAVLFTITYFCGLFKGATIVELIIFDVVCLSYFVIAKVLRNIGIISGGKVDNKKLLVTGIVLASVIILQWNLISYIIPSRAFWGYAPMFVLLTAFLFNTKIVLVEIAGLSVSIAISWIIKGDLLLPIRDNQFYENFVLRIVALVTSFVIIYLLTYFAEKFIGVAKESTALLETKNKELENMGKDIIDFTADIIEERDSGSGYHVKRLKAYTKILAEQIASMYPEYGLTDEKIENISLACVLHDIGKIAIPDRILLKPGKLTPEEFDVMKTHSDIGAKIIDKLPDSVEQEYKTYCREICQFHHEKYDGKGYPSGLKGDEIPISAQIVSVVDCYDALISERPYKKPLPKELAINMILNGECGEFSEKMKNSLIACKDKMINC